MTSDRTRQDADVVGRPAPPLDHAANVPLGQAGAPAREEPRRGFLAAFFMGLADSGYGSPPEGMPWALRIDSDEAPPGKDRPTR